VVGWHDCDEKWSKRGDAGKICRMQSPKKVSSNHFLIGRFEDENLGKKMQKKFANDWCEHDFVKFIRSADTGRAGVKGATVVEFFERSAVKFE